MVDRIVFKSSPKRA